MSQFTLRDWRDSDLDVVASWWDTDDSLRTILGADPLKHLDEHMPERLVATNGASDTPVCVVGMRVFDDVGVPHIVMDPEYRKGFNAMTICRGAEQIAKSRGIKHLVTFPHIESKHTRALARYMRLKAAPVIVMTREL